ncbi:MAG: hypothetical protein M5U32_11025 [Myxococcota bacterium]|nr:hypothetical protein [Myxococcota bacterium]
MGDFKAPSVLSELMTLWRIATSAERVAFLAHVTTAPDVQRTRLPADSGPLPLVRLGPERDR